MHAGGPFAHADARITVSLKEKPFRPQTPIAKGFLFDSGQIRNRKSQTLHQTSGRVDDKGELTSVFRLADSRVLHGRITAESAVRDERGKYVSGFAGADFVGRDRFVGLRQRDWLLHEDRPAQVEVMVVDASGVPVPGVPVRTKITRKETKAARVKGAGNAYLTRYTHEWVDVHECKRVSESEPSVCPYTPEEPGDYRITAIVKDTKGRQHQTQLDRWVVGKGRVLWSQRPDNRLQILPEKDRYKIGDTARYLVKNPFPGALALITVERYGVIKQWVKPLEDSTPVIAFPVEADFLPGYYLSVLVISPRVEKPPGEGGGSIWASPRSAWVMSRPRYATR